VAPANVNGGWVGRVGGAKGDNGPSSTRLVASSEPWRRLSGHAPLVAASRGQLCTLVLSLNAQLKFVYRGNPGAMIR
jgi:hypothetical protein